MDGLAREVELTRQPSGRFALGDAALQEHQIRGSLAATLKARATQQGLVFRTRPTAIGIIVALGTEAPAIITRTLRAHKAVGVQMPFQPDQAQAIVKQIRNREIDQGVLPPRRGCARGSIPSRHGYWT